MKACAKVANPAKITEFFNTMKDRYLTDALKDAYKREIAALKLDRLKVTVAPAKGRNGARFAIDLDGRKVGCNLSEVLSEGERRALSLAAFLAEQSIGGGSGCLVFDDPVSSLDHWWAKVIADRLVEEARSRQVIVFTHDLVFYDKLCTAVEDAGAPLDFHQLFSRSDTRTAGHVDRVRSNWNSQRVRDRVTDLNAMIQHAAQTYADSPASYVIEAKGIYGRMRDTWERLIEELLFAGVVQRFQKGVSSLKLKYLTAHPTVLSRIEAGMTKTSTFSHDNAPGSSDHVPDPVELKADLDELNAVAELLRKHQRAIDEGKPSPIGGGG
ncbi:AAA family ATPase [Magnetospirillum sp. SS-4]|uniref:AAA family ATPase n=1 Tax=Magnetospirillum sp. SS-4 TaxID=2681465 RepID=UPI001384DB0D|nr:AAA family ATPase [Magnetospirillum sp. SS-4]CAA7624370.1 hypothetical protein MTBSS4_460019 [Magnetospirillum sp. SS-4]